MSRSASDSHVSPPRVLVFTPSSLVPPRSGYHRRALSLISAMHDEGWGVVVAGLAGGDGPLGPEFGDARTSVSARRYRDPRRGPLARRVVGGLRRIDGRAAPVTERLPDRRRWFRGIIQQERPDIILVNYARWSGLVPGRRDGRPLTVVDMNDLLSLNTSMWRALEQELGPGPVSSRDPVAAAVTRLDYFDRPAVRAQRSEFRALDRFDVTLAISTREAALVERETQRTHVVTLPAIATPEDVDNRYDGPILYAAGLNPFNVQGHLYFTHRVLPLIRAALPAFQLRVVGDVCDRLVEEPNVTLEGYVPDLRGVYASARFGICPVFGGTGEKIKIVDAMARGLPVIALDRAAEGSPLADRETGFIVQTAEEFARRCVQLWQDPTLCRSMGERARQVVRSERSPELARRVLAEVLLPRL